MEHRFWKRLVIAIMLFSAQYGVCGVEAPDETVYMKDDEIVSVTITKGDTLKLVCGGVQEIIEESRTSWFKDNKTLRPDELPTTLLSRAYLLMNRARPEDQGMYQCQVHYPSYKNPYIDRTVNVLVVTDKDETDSMENADAEFDYEEYDQSEEEAEQARRDKNIACSKLDTTQLQDENLTYLCIDFENKKPMTHFLVRATGNTVVLYCHARGNPMPTVKWLKDGVQMEKAYHRKIQRNSLTLEDLTPSDKAIYTCQISNNYTSFEYDTRLEIVQGSHSKPLFSKIPSNITVYEGQTAIFQVGIMSGPEYDLEWIKHDNEDPRNTTVVKSRMENEIYSDPDILVLENVTRDDEGWYTAMVGNSIGRSMTTNYLLVLPGPPPSEDEEDGFNSQIEAQDEATTHMILPLPVVISGPILTAFIFIFAFALLFSYCKYGNFWFRREKKEIYVRWVKQVIIQKQDPEEGQPDELGLYRISMEDVMGEENGPEYYFPLDLKWEFNREHLTLGKKLGEGAFGEVVMGFATGLLSPGVTTTVAVKRLKPIHTEDDLADLVSECEVMKEMGKHVNVLGLLGCCTQGGDLLVLTEFAQNGNLRDYMRARRAVFLRPNKPENQQPNMPQYCNIPDSSDKNTKKVIYFSDLMSFAFQVARGMEYLTNMKFVHRDLAARNVLVADHTTVKIGDFGMSRNTTDKDYYRKRGDGRVPVKWMAPETLNCRYYTSQSDVWAYGILLWEIVTLGSSPYPTVPDVTMLLDFLTSGRRMDRPAGCPADLYLIMRECWDITPARRPTFSELVEDIERILNIVSGVEYMEMELNDVTPLSLEWDEVVTPESTPENSDGQIQIKSDRVIYINDRKH